MTVLLKKKPIAVSPAADPYAALKAKIDEVGRMEVEAKKIEARIKAEQAKLKPYKDGVAELLAMVEEFGLSADQVLEKSGESFAAEFGAKGQSRSITDLGKVRSFMGDDLFMQLASVTLKNIDDYLTPPQKEACLTTERTKRSVKFSKV